MRTLLVGRGRLDAAGERRSRRTAPYRRSSTSRRLPAGTSVRRTTSTASSSPDTSRCGRSSTTTSRLDRWTVPVAGPDAYQVAVGPIHAGVIESGHFRFHVVGDRILHLDARLFYKHRGLEQAAEGTTLDDGAGVRRARLRGLRGPNGVAYAHACEHALGLEPTGELARARTILLELERTWSHLNDIAAVCAGRRPGRRQHLLRRAHRARPSAERRAHRPPLPLRDRPRGR